MVVAPDPVRRPRSKNFASAARRLEAPCGFQEEATQELAYRTGPTWASSMGTEDHVPHADLRGDDGVKLLSAFARKESGRDMRAANGGPCRRRCTRRWTRFLQAAQEALASRTGRGVAEKNRLPVLIYLRRDLRRSRQRRIYPAALFLKTLNGRGLRGGGGRAPDDPRIRTINAMFNHVRLTAKEDCVTSAASQAQRGALPQNQKP